MAIVDKQHSAQLVTEKGKPYLFDAIECLVPFMKENRDKKPGLILVADYHQPGNLIDANTAQYLISPAIPSPMGGYLSAFNSKEEAAAMKEAKGGKLFSFEELKKGLAEK
jgi:copper chaperone NosL